MWGALHYPKRRMACCFGPGRDARAGRSQSAGSRHYLGVPVLSVGLVGTSGRSPFLPICGFSSSRVGFTSARVLAPVGCAAFGWPCVMVVGSPLGTAGLAEFLFSARASDFTLSRDAG